MRVATAWSIPPLAALLTACPGPVYVAGSGSSTAAEPVDCVDSMIGELELRMLPLVPDEGPEWLDIEVSCPVDYTLDGDPWRLDIICPGETAVFTLQAFGLVEPPPSQLVAGTEVELQYSRSRDAPRQPAWLALWLTTDVRPLFVAIAAPRPHSWSQHDPINTGHIIDFVEATTCAEEDGSCNTGPKRRGAVRITGDNEETTVFDHNVGQLGDYRIQVGDAIVDDGYCDDGDNETWFELVMIRTTPE